MTVIRSGFESRRLHKADRSDWVTDQTGPKSAPRQRRSPRKRRGYTQPRTSSAHFPDTETRSRRPHLRSACRADGRRLTGKALGPSGFESPASPPSGPKCWVIDNGRWRSRKARSREGGCSKYPARPLVRPPSLGAAFEADLGADLAATDCAEDSDVALHRVHAVHLDVGPVDPHVPLRAVLLEDGDPAAQAPLGYSHSWASSPLPATRRS